MKMLKIGTKTVLAVFFIVGLVGCLLDSEGLDGRYVKDAQGNIYVIRAGLGEIYYINKPDESGINDFNKLKTD